MIITVHVMIDKLREWFWNGFNYLANKSWKIENYNEFLCLEMYQTAVENGY